MLTTNQSTQAEQPLQGVLVSKYESKASDGRPEGSNFSKLFSSMQLKATSEASVATPLSERSVLTGEGLAELMTLPQVSDSDNVDLSIVQQVPILDTASNHAGSDLSNEFTLNGSGRAVSEIIQQFLALDTRSNQSGSNLPAKLSSNDAGGVTLPDATLLDVASNDSGRGLPGELNLKDLEDVARSQSSVLGVASNDSDRELSGELSLNDLENESLSIRSKMPALDISANHAENNPLAELDLNGSDLKALHVVSNGRSSAELSSNDSGESLMTEEEIAAPVIDGGVVKVDSAVLVSSSAVSSKAEKTPGLVEDASDVIVQSVVLNQTSPGSEKSVSVQLNGGLSNAASNSITSWGVQGYAAGSVSGGDVQVGAQQNQALTQGGQSGQHSQSQGGQQQAMMFTQFIKEGKAQALEQQAAVRAVDESALKSEVKDLLGGAEVASMDRRGQLPLGLQSIQQPLKHPQWGKALGQRVVFMANNSIQQAQITLNPEKLGQVQVTLQLDKNQKMNVSLNAQNGVTRESMENALPKLREMLEQAGISLGSMDVSDQKQFSGNSADKPTSGEVASNNAIEEEDTVIESTLSTVKTTDNIVDYYA